MAIKKNIVKDLYGKEVVFTDSYIVIGNISNYKTFMLASVCIYTDSTKGHKLSESIYKIEYDINKSNPFIQAYEYLKTLEEFKDSEDC